MGFIWWGIYFGITIRLQFRSWPPVAHVCIPSRGTRSQSKVLGKGGTQSSLCPRTHLYPRRPRFSVGRTSSATQSESFVAPAFLLNQ